MGRTMLQFHHPGGPPPLPAVLSGFGLGLDDVDEAFGVVATDPRAGLFVIQVDDRALPKVRAALEQRPPHPAEGLFGDPHVEPFGPSVAQ